VQEGNECTKREGKWYEREGDERQLRHFAQATLSNIAYLQDTFLFR